MNIDFGQLVKETARDTQAVYETAYQAGYQAGLAEGIKQARAIMESHLAPLMKEQA